MNKVSLCAKLLSILCLSALLAPSAFADVVKLRVGMPQQGKVPFFWQTDMGEYTGIYVDTLRLVAKELNIELEIIPLPQARLQRHFVAGEIDLEAGVNPKAEISALLEDFSLYSRPFGVVNEVFIYRPELSFPVFILKDLEGQRVATVRGSSVPERILREDFTNQWQIAQRVHRGWNKLGLMNEAPALHYQRAGKLNYQISLPYNSNPVVFRLHVSKSKLLEPINDSISRLEEEGELERIVCKYLCGQSATLPDNDK